MAFVESSWLSDNSLYGTQVGPTLTVMIEPGQSVQVRDALGQLHDRIAITEELEGYDFPVVWACRPEEWEAAQREQRQPEGVPWPAVDVQEVPEVVDA